MEIQLLQNAEVGPTPGQFYVFLRMLTWTVRARGEAEEDGEAELVLVVPRWLVHPGMINTQCPLFCVRYMYYLAVCHTYGHSKSK